MTEYTLLKKSIAFDFCQATRDGFFRNETEWGFTLAGNDFDANKARWGRAVKIGPEVTEVAVGDYILIDPLKWTLAVDVDGKKLWRTDESYVALVTSEKPKDIM
ncbi:hypothetical protein Xoosp13_233 [Xanthomonas phage Xoo-sp13]|nr:hypothetical protein Xoosp13_233 [Xanthomonas phage Xoo-sp13]